MTMPAASPEDLPATGHATRQLHDTLNMLGVLPNLQQTVDNLPRCAQPPELHHHQTADAAEKVLNLVDTAKADQEHIARKRASWPN